MRRTVLTVAVAAALTLASAPVASAQYAPVPWQATDCTAATALVVVLQGQLAALSPTAPAEVREALQADLDAAIETEARLCAADDDPSDPILPDPTLPPTDPTATPTVTPTATPTPTSAPTPTSVPTGSPTGVPDPTVLPTATTTPSRDGGATGGGVQVPRWPVGGVDPGGTPR